ncbi:unnamed protein product [Camellia sinensis]
MGGWGETGRGRDRVEGERQRAGGWGERGKGRDRVREKERDVQQRGDKDGMGEETWVGGREHRVFGQESNTSVPSTCIKAQTSSSSSTTTSEEYSSPTLYKVNVDQNGKRLILPSGYTFSPRDSELVVHYLKKKILNQELPANIITTIDVYSYDSPNQLPFREFKYGLPNEWYFFTTRPPHNLLLTSNGGGWNELADETVVDNDKVIGYKRRLAFYFAKPLQEMETDWFIHEYRVSPAIFAPDELIDNTIKDKKITSNLEVQSRLK